MREARHLIFFGVLTFFLCCKTSQKADYTVDEARLLSHIVHPVQELHFYWKDSSGVNYKNFGRLKSALHSANKELIFAMNGGMYNKDLSPQGLYIENGVTKSQIDTTKEGYGNFYLQPNGIFYLTKDNKPVICTTEKFKNNTTIKYATQSGPVLLIDGKIHSKLNQGSPNLHIRNGVGILPNGSLLFAMSKEKINFYDFASYFKQHGCKNALYLDGFVSKTYLPAKDWEQLDGNFGVIIGQIKTAL